MFNLSNRETSDNCAIAKAEAVALGAAADLENYKKRFKQEVDKEVHNVLCKYFAGLLSVGDNLERAIASASDTESSLVEGVKIVYKEFLLSLSKIDIFPIESVGKFFDPSKHHAIQSITSNDYPPGMIIDEYEKGYIRDGKLLRAARVIVAGPDSTGDVI